MNFNNYIKFLFIALIVVLSNSFYIVNEKGEGVTGLYEDEYNNSNETPIARICNPCPQSNSK